MSWVAGSPSDYKKTVVGDGQCVAFVVKAASMPHTAAWKRGDLAKGGVVVSGTAIATFDDDSTYGNHTDGRSHAAIFIELQDGGLLVWDQWVGHSVDQRVIKFRGGSGKPVNDGDAFYIIEPV